MRVENLIEDLKDGVRRSLLLIFGFLYFTSPITNKYIMLGEAARPAGGVERGTSSDGKRSGSPKTSLSLQLQHCPRVPQEQAGKSHNV